MHRTLKSKLDELSAPGEGVKRSIEVWLTQNLNYLMASPSLWMTLQFKTEKDAEFAATLWISERRGKVVKFFRDGRN